MRIARSKKGFLSEQSKEVEENNRMGKTRNLFKKIEDTKGAFYAKMGTIKKAKCQKIDAFELWCWRRLLRIPWTTRRSSQPVLKEINPEYSLEGLMLKLKLQYFGFLM